MKKMRTQFGKDLPYFIFGHSWGSLIARLLTARLHNVLNKEVEGVVLCGTVVPFLQDETIFETVRKKVEGGQGGMCDDDLVAQLFALLFARVPNVKNRNEWIALDEGGIADNFSDPMNT